MGTSRERGRNAPLFLRWGGGRAGITDECLLAYPEQHAQQDVPDDVRLAAPVPDLIFPVQRADQQKHQAQKPQPS